MAIASMRMYASRFLPHSALQVDSTLREQVQPRPEFHAQVMTWRRQPCNMYPCM